MEIGKIHAADLEKMVTITAGLVREGVTFEAESAGSGAWVITLTGGY